MGKVTIAEQLLLYQGLLVDYVLLFGTQKFAPNGPSLLQPSHPV
jgi:hypothetical protein